MKIANSIRNIYEETKPVYDLLRGEVDEFFNSNKTSRWHYESRVKGLISFALKAETSRVSELSRLEDFFGACLVVENSASIQTALDLISTKFEIAYQRPKVHGQTHKDPSSFVFDDIRLYLRIPSNPDRRPKGVEDIVFELQLKTFLQHAWSIATHDMVYKGDESSWASNRIAFQVKAMLEHAELSISESAALSKSPLVNKENKKTIEAERIITFLRETWPKEQLPSDLIRLSSNVMDILSIIRLDLDCLKGMAASSEHIGDSPKINMSPFSAISLVIIENVEDLKKRLKARNKKLFLPEEVVALLDSNKREELKGVIIEPR